MALGLALLALPALAQPTPPPPDVLAAAQSIRDTLRNDRYLIEAAAAYEGCGLRLPGWRRLVVRNILARGEQRLEASRGHTSDPRAYWQLAVPLWDEHWARANRISARTRFSPSECLDAQQLPDLGALLDRIYMDSP